MHRVARHRAPVFAAGVALMIALAVAGAAAAWHQQKEPVASSGWVKLPVPGETSTTAFVSVDNPTMYAIYLLSAASDVAGKIEMRDVDKDGAETREAVTEVTVPAYGGVEMGPKGLHLVLSDLKRPLKEVDKVTLSVITETGTKLDVEAPVRKNSYYGSARCWATNASIAAWSTLVNWTPARYPSGRPAVGGSSFAHTTFPEQAMVDPSQGMTTLSSWFGLTVEEDTT